MPISPVASRPTPAAFCSRASSAPVRMARSACARVMAGPWVMSPVPSPRRRSSTPGMGPGSFIPMSTGTTRHPATAAILQTEERLAPAFRATAAVTSWPLWATPWASTPLSAHSSSSDRRDRSTL